MFDSLQDCLCSKKISFFILGQLTKLTITKKSPPCKYLLKKHQQLKKLAKTFLINTCTMPQNGNFKLIFGLFKFSIRANTGNIRFSALLGQCSVCTPHTSLHWLWPAYSLGQSEFSAAPLTEQLPRAPDPCHRSSAQ